MDIYYITSKGIAAYPDKIAAINRLKNQKIGLNFKES